MFRVFLGLPRYCSVSGMLADAHADCFYALMRKRIVSVTRNVLESTNTILKTLADRPGSALKRHWVSGLINPYAEHTKSNHETK